MNRFYILFAVLFLIFAGTAEAGAQADHFRKADKYFSKLAYSKAIPLYEKGLKKNQSLQAKMNLADSYRLTENFSEAEKWYGEIASEANIDPNYVLYYAQMLQSNWKTKQALTWFSKYKEMRPEDKRGELFMKDCADLDNLLRDSAYYRIHNLDINSSLGDMSPSFWRDGIVFPSERKGQNQADVAHTWMERPFMDLFYSDGNGGNNDEFEVFSRELNTSYHEGPLSFSRDGKEVFFTRNNYISKKTGKDEAGTIRLKILYARLKDGEWGNIQELPFNSDEYTVAHPAISLDGTALYFVSDMPGGLGKSDIYVVERQGSKWGTPVNLGEGINSAGEESFLFMHADGTLYFASDGLGGLGGLDIYQTKLKSSGDWTTPQNVGFPINSRTDDFGLIWNENRSVGYFASDRDGGRGSDDIYSVYSQGIHLRGVVYDMNTHERIEDAMVELLDAEQLKGSNQTGKRGDFIFTTVGNKEYVVRAQAPGYGSAERIVDLNGISFPAYGYVEIPMSIPGGGNPNFLATGPGRVIGQVVDRNTKTPIADATVLIKNKCAKRLDAVQTNIAGFYSFEISEDCEFELSADKSGYIGDEDNVLTAEIEDPTEIVSVMELGSLQAGNTIVLENIYYDYNKDYIREDAVPELNRLITLLNDNPGMKIQIGSHTDSRSTYNYNADLSQRRALAVVNWLVEHGIEKDRLTAIGYGESRIRNGCGNGVPCSEEGHQFNRRTEFTVLYMGQTTKSTDKFSIPVNTWKIARNQ